MELKDLEMRPEIVIFELIQSSGRAESKIDTILENQKVITERINKRETEIETLSEKLGEVDKRLVKVETSQANNWKWFIGIGTIGAGIGAVVAIFI